MNEKKQVKQGRAGGHYKVKIESVNKQSYKALVIKMIENRVSIDSSYK